MLTSPRFTTIPTKKTRDRLEDVLSNNRPIAKGEKKRSAVIAIQCALSDLNQEYLSSAECDGFFGGRTAQAVEAFQRDYGLFADGIVGRQTLIQLDSVYSADVVREPYGYGIHVGVDFVDDTHYGGKFELQSCVNDARAMRDLAEEAGYDTLVLENDAATTSSFTAAMRNAVDSLFAGDSLLITFSGHGSQITNTSADSETDMRDETLCFYDRMLIDDEFYGLLTQVREGVTVHAIFDSCHSGTVAKQIDGISIDEEKEMRQKEHEEKCTKTLNRSTPFTGVSLKTIALTEEGIDGADVGDDEELRPISGDSVSKALDGERPVFAEAPKPKDDARDQEIVSLFGELYSNGTTGEGKSIAFFSRIYEENKELYDAVKTVIGDKESQQPVCSVVTLSACEDSQTTPAGQVLSLFTYNVTNAWRSGDFNGSYRQFHNVIKNASRADATPQLNTYGAPRSNARLYERPFVF